MHTMINKNLFYPPPKKKKFALRYIVLLNVAQQQIVFDY